MNLNHVAAEAADEISKVIDPPLSAEESAKVCKVIAEAMQRAVTAASDEHANVCTDCIAHDRDLVHKLHSEMERKKVSLIANLSSLR